MSETIKFEAGATYGCKSELSEVAYQFRVIVLVPKRIWVAQVEEGGKLGPLIGWPLLVGEDSEDKPCEFCQPLGERLGMPRLWASNLTDDGKEG